MGTVRVVWRWFVRAALVASMALVCFNAAARRAAAREPDLAVGPVRLVRSRPRACLLLHGWLSSPADFGDLPRALDEAGWDVYAPAHPGHGSRPAELEGVTADRLLGAAREHYRRLRARYPTVALVGFSMGGTMATILASEAPPDRLVLVAPFYGVRHKWYYVLPSRWWHALLSPFLRYNVRPASLTRVNRPAGLNEIAAYDAYPISALGALFELRRRAVADVDPGRLDMPVLLLHSTGDEACSCAAMRALVDRMSSPHKRVVVFARSNHHLLHDYERREAIEAVTAFLGAEGAPGRPPDG